MRSLFGVSGGQSIVWWATGTRAVIDRFSFGMRDLVLAPEAELSRVFEYAGLDFDAGGLPGMVAAVAGGSDVLADHRDIR